MAHDGVRVAVRTRPISKKEQQLGSKCCVVLDQARAEDGYNGTIFAYGQTGSGKTWTMMGNDEKPGLIPQLNMNLFRMVKEMSTEKEGGGEEEKGEEGKKAEETTISFLITVSYIEIYNEVIMDLLNPSDKKLLVRESPDLGVYVQGASLVVCKSEADVMRLVNQGGAVRKVAATQMNATSSRSHSVFTIKVEKRTFEKTEEKTKETMLTSKINLVDLAGSERASKTGASGDTLKEGAAINKSLMALGQVINALGDLAKGKNVHIPYRDSQLTRLLQESLGGNASTLMVAALSPADYNHDETLTTLQYARRVKMVENKVEKNEDVHEKEVRKLKEEIEELKAMLAKGGGGAEGAGGAGESEADKEKAREMMEKIKELEEGKSGAWEEKERLSRELEEERGRNMGVAIGGIIENVKEEKIRCMKKIKKLQNHRGKNVEKGKKGKADYGKLKKGMEGDMERYKALQGDFEAMADGSAEKDKAEVALAELLDKIEEVRGSLVEKKKDLLRLKEDNEKIDEELIEARAELVSAGEVLNQNDDLRKKIVEEERKKFEATKDEYLEKELREERERIETERDKIKSEHKGNRIEMMKRLGALKVEMNKERSTKEVLLQNELDMKAKECTEREEEIRMLKEEIARKDERAVELEVGGEEKDEEIKGLREELERERNKRGEVEGEVEMSLAREKELMDVEDGEGAVEIMMEGVNRERKLYQEKYEEMKALLRQAMIDVVYLSKKVKALGG
ncbi:hypothetical protein TrRE_jg1943 [Triparma retinervis]|uniref:Kinesin-like protein n=1 Tax=Triparma retinervis TaxID=2557542 RepID=A0A9W6ZAW6_9STRA|nr:hypothetical protein TrRE_jg1943 [Triparma retinervis]